MKTIDQLGAQVASARKARRLTQEDLARQAGLARESLARFERGRFAEFGSRKLLALLAALGLEISFVESGISGTLDELRRERGSA